MSDAADRYQTLDGQGHVSWNLVYNSTSGNWELEQQAVIDSITGNFYAAIDDLEGFAERTANAVESSLALKQDEKSEYKLSDFDASGDPIYVGKVNKDGSWIITEFNIANGTARYISGSSDYSTNWTGRAGLSYDTYDTEF